MRTSDSTGDTRLMRELNTRIVLDCIRRQEPISRAAIARQAHLARPTVSSIVTDLLQRRLVLESGPGSSSAGRRPTLLELNAQENCALGLNLGVTDIDAAIVDLRGQIVSAATCPTGPADGQAAVIRRMVGLATSALAGSDGSRVVALGIGVPGLVDSQRGVNTFSPNLGWRDVPLKDIFETQTRHQALVGNNARAMALAESWYGAAGDVDNFVWIHVGTGVGAGIFLRGELYHGDGWGAGEIGHTCVDPHGPLCQCGNRGCLEALCSAPSIVRRALSALDEGLLSTLSQHGDEIGAEMVSAAAQEGDEVARRILQETGKWLGIGIANLMDTLNIRLVILGGGVIRAGEVLLSPVRQTVKARIMSMPAEAVEIIPSPLEPNAGAMGAATLVFDWMFSSPLEFVRP